MAGHPVAFGVGAEPGFWTSAEQRSAFAGGSKSGSNQLQEIGFGLAAGIVMDTFLVRTLLVPSTVILLGRWNWWPSPLVGRLLVTGRAGLGVRLGDQQPTDQRRWPECDTYRGAGGGRPSCRQCAALRDWLGLPPVS